MPVITAPSTTTAPLDSAPFIIGNGALIVVVGLIGFTLRQRPKVQYCLRCGQTLGPDGVCSNCGAGAGKFTAPN
jgi:hypothetical protein